MRAGFKSQLTNFHGFLKGPRLEKIIFGLQIWKLMCGLEMDKMPYTAQQKMPLEVQLETKDLEVKEMFGNAPETSCAPGCLMAAVAQNTLA